MSNTTNSLDSFFGHLKDAVRVHRGLKLHRKTKLIELSYSQINSRIIWHLYLNYHTNGAHPTVFDYQKDVIARKKIFEQLGLPEKASPSEITAKWYEINKGSYPYAAIHLFGNLWFTPTIYILGDEDRIKHRGEVRLIPKDFEREAYDARIPFKMYGSLHLTPAK